VASGATLTTELVNGMINRTEYAADLLRQYKLTAGTDMYVEPHYDGTRVSYYYPVSGGTTPQTPPISDRIIMELGKEYYFPLNFDFATKIYKLAFPAYANSDRTRYALVIYGAYWAYLDSTPDNFGRYQVFYSSTRPATILLSNPSSFSNLVTLPNIGPHPSGKNPITGQSINYWVDPGSAKLIRV
jgi:hypothetical protein